MDEREDCYISKPAISDNIAEFFRGLLKLPKDVVRLNASIPVQKVISSVDEYIVVQVAEVYDPSKFWFNLQTFVVKLNTLMDEMLDFYQERHQEYAVSRCGIHVGLYCVVIYMHDYHRAVVTNLMEHSDTSLKVFFIAYGTVSTVSKDGLCYLHVNFAELPAQALWGRLAKIHPPSKNVSWSIPSLKYFLKMVRNKECIAQIIAKDENTKIFKLLIADTSGEEDIFINDCLVLAGYTRFEHRGWKDVFNYSKHIPLVENIHLYPTFEVIESAKVPGFTELLIISNIPLGKIYRQYFREKKSDDEKNSYLETQKSTSGKCTVFRLEDVKIKTTDNCDNQLFNQTSNQQNLQNKMFDSPVRIVPAYGYQKMQPVFYYYPQSRMVCTNQHIPPTYAQNKRASSLIANAPVYVHYNENVARVSAHNKNDDRESKKEGVVIEEVVNPPSRRRFAVKAELFGINLHVILYNEQPHLLIGEIHAHYPGKPLLMLKRMLCMERLIAVNLKINKELRNELIKKNAVGGNKDIVDVIPLRHISDVVECLDKETIPMENLESALRQYNRDSQENV